MSASYEDTVAALYQAPHAEFVTERKRLSTELKAGGDKAGAARLAKLPRPSISAWAVNQLWWHARSNFDELLAAAELLRRGERQAASAHREALTRLRARAAALLGEAGHAATEGTLRRVATSLSALAASGGFAPDPPGALSVDRDPPGFDAARVGFAPPGLASNTNREDTDTPRVEPEGPPQKRERMNHGPDTEAAGAETKAEAKAEAERQRLEQERIRAEAAEKRQRLEQERAQAEAERQRLEQERVRVEAERQRLQAELRTARGQVEAQARDVERLRKQLTAAEQQLALARETAATLEQHLAARTREKGTVP